MDSGVVPAMSAVSKLKNEDLVGITQGIVQNLIEGGKYLNLSDET